MANKHVLKRLGAIRKMLMMQYEAGSGFSSASKGRERELFVQQFLEASLPPSFRVGDGDITDVFGKKSGQVDLVVECFQWPSLPVVIGGTRLYTAEGVAAVVEVKSNIRDQWKEVVETARNVRKLTRHYNRMITGNKPPKTLKKIPIYAVGYSGWKKTKTIEKKATSGVVDGILVLEKGIFSFTNNKGDPESFSGDWSLLGFLRAMHSVTRNVTFAIFDPGWYRANEEQLADL